jgi:hypothetical protein
MITSQAHHAAAMPFRSADYLRGPLHRAGPIIGGIDFYLNPFPPSRQRL